MLVGGKLEFLFKSGIHLLFIDMNGKNRILFKTFHLLRKNL